MFTLELDRDKSWKEWIYIQAPPELCFQDDLSQCLDRTYGKLSSVRVQSQPRLSSRLLEENLEPI